MTVSPEVQKIAHVQKAVHKFITPLGFRKFGRTHNRHTDDGPIHVINFQSGQRSLQGKFTVNLGVVFPCVAATESSQPLPNYVTDTDCHISTRLGVLAYQEDRWFDGDLDTATLAATVIDLLTRVGLPFLDQFGSYPTTLSILATHGTLPGQTPDRSALTGAIIAHHIGDTNVAQSLFEKACLSDKTPFRAHAIRIAQRVGHFS